VEFDHLLRESDIVSVHVPLNRQTTGMISTRELGLMKPTAYLINTCRGPVVDEGAHSDQQSQFTHFGLFDPEVDALVEKSESTVDFAENINIVKQIQSLVLSKYSSVMFFFTPDHYDVYDSRLQGWELIPQSAAKYRTELWFKES
jgi:ABC-type transport system substrate-binding protein